MTSAMDLSSLEEDPRLFLYTSLTAGSSHIITATSRMETILKANKIPFQAIDTATDEKARRLWQRRSQGKKLPGLVKEGFVLGDLEQVEEWNEFGELKENIGDVPASNAAPPGGQTGVNIAPPLPVNPTATAGTAQVKTPGNVSKAAPALVDASKMRPLPGAAEIAARNSKPQEESRPSVIDDPPKPETMDSAPVDKEKSINAAKAMLKADHPSIDHLSAPASRIQSGTATPANEADATEDKAEATGGAENQAPTAGASETEGWAKKVEGRQVGDGVCIQTQDAKEPEAAGKSVED